MDNQSYRYNMSVIPRIRVLSLGNCSVGKSCLIKRYCEQRFVQRYMPTIGIDYGSTTVEVDGQQVSIHFFDTSGNALFEEVRSEFYPDMQGVLLMYDVTDRSTFVALDAWMAELRHNLGHNGVSKLVIVVVGTRSDTGGSVSGRQVSDSEGQAWATQYRAKHIVTSAALGTGVTDAFMTLFSEALQSKENINFSPVNPAFQPKSGGGSKQSPSKSSSYTTSTQGTTANKNTSSSNNSNNQTNAKPSSNKNVPNMATKTKATAPPKTQTSTTDPNVDPEAASAITRLIHSSDNFTKLQLNRRTVTKEEVNKAYRKLASLVHPDKCKAPKAEEAFKMLAHARTAVLALITETTV